MQLIFQIEETKVSLWWHEKMIHLKAAAVTICIILKKKIQAVPIPSLLRSLEEINFNDK